jgi:hypothetical protein
MNEAFTSEPLEMNEDLWESALYYTTITSAPTQLMRDGIRKALRAYSNLPEDFQRSSLEAAYGLDPQAFLLEMSQISDVTTTPKHFAMAGLYLARGLPRESDAASDVLQRMRAKFPDWEQNPILTMLNHDLQCTSSKPGVANAGAANSTATAECAHPLPPLRAIFDKSFEPGRTVVYTLQRHNRDYPGLALVRGPDGKFHRNPDGTIFHLSHLARSRTNLPGYITNGNTPQGIFTIVGVSRTKSSGIGQTPFLHTMLPLEASAAEYFHDPALAGTSWTMEMYLKQFPDATAAGWRNYFPMKVAWYAGVAGRSEMLSHGTAMDPSPYVNTPWYPSTPTSGCICAKELWDADGKPLLSDQLALVHAYLEASGVRVPRENGEGIITLQDRGPKGYFVVIELNGKEQPVTLDEVLTEVLAADTGSN